MANLPVIYISDTFLEKLNENYNKKAVSTFETVISPEKLTVNKIRILLCNAIIKNITTIEGKNSIRSKMRMHYGNKDFQELSDFILHKAMKQQNLYLHTEILENEIVNNAISDNAKIFGCEDSFNTNAIQQEYGIFSINTDYTFHDNFFGNKNLSNKPISSHEGWELEEASFLSNAMVVLDPYIFNDSRIQKLPNIVRFIKFHFDSKMKTKFHLTIITTIANNNNLFKEKTKLLCEMLGGAEKIFIEVIATQKDKINLSDKSDRWILTNHYFMIIGHPFDRPTNFSSNFLISNDKEEELRNNYNVWINKLKKAKDIIDNTPDSFGLYHTKFRTGSESNRLFNCLT